MEVRLRSRLFLGAMSEQSWHRKQMEGYEGRRANQEPMLPGIWGVTTGSCTL